MRRLLLFLPVLGAVLAADQATKAWARGALEHGPLPLFDGTVYFRLGLNPGIAFSLLTQAGARWLLAAVAVAVAVGIAWWLAKRELPRTVQVGAALVAGGALGNGIDRMLAGKVTDFVVIQIGSHVWPTFNVADAALVLGVILFLVGGSLRPRWASSSP